MKGKTKYSISEAQPDFEELRARGYRIHQFLPWHYRVTHEDYETEIDVWPTTRKLCNRFAGPAWVYRDMVKEVERAFAKEDQ